MAVTKADIVNAVSNRLEMGKQGSSEAVEALLEIMKENLANGEDVLVSGFGKFCVKDKKQRKGRNPQTGNEMILAPRRVVTFRCSLSLKNKLNGK